MDESDTPTTNRPPKRTPGRRSGRAPRWHVVYSLLALFDVLVVGAGLVYVRGIVHRHNSAIATTRVWDEWANQLAGVERSALAVSTPARQAIITGGESASRVALDNAVGTFTLRLDKLRSELLVAANRELRPVLADLGLVESVVGSLKTTSSNIIAAVAAGRPAEAVADEESLTEIERVLSDRMRLARADLQTVRATELDRQSRDINGLQNFEYLIEGLFLVMILGATVYGSRLRSEFERRTRERDEQLAELEAAHAELTKAREVLDERVASRTMELDRTNQILRAEIDERRRAEADLRLSEERYALAAQSANDGLWDWDLRSGQFYTSPRWRALLGLTDQEFGGTINEWFDRVHPDDRVALQIRVGTHLQDPKQPLEMEHRILHHDGTYHWMLVRATAVGDEAGQPARMVGSHSDVTDRKTAELQLLHMSRHDTLTGLPNRAYFMDHLDAVVRKSRALTGFRFAVLFVDLDRFKSVNDSLGHAIGDSLLREVARRLTTVVRPGDMVSRLGGDEFTILVEDVINEAGAVAVAERVLAALREPVRVEGFEIRTGASIGIAFNSVTYTGPGDILRDADTAMYRAKSEGRGSYRIFESTMYDSAIDSLVLGSEISLALDRGQFELNYQPVVEPATQRLVGCEALVRWRHPEHGLVSPGIFLGVAETSGFIVDLGRWVIDRACAQGTEWLVHFPETSRMFISVNVSPKELWEPDFVEFIEAVLQRYDVPTGSLRLEITEAGLMRNQSETEAVLHRLGRLGVGIIVDDFGMGHSTTAYLRSLPLVAVKIDKSVVAISPDDEAKATSARAEIERAKLLGVDVIAEGIETAEQESLVLDSGCRLVQGYRYSAPLGATEATGWLVAVRQRTNTTG
jgi:diguanylate cyclase (GGDEF)-like protein/PAS domain S-box-containing protein